MSVVWPFIAMVIWMLLCIATVFQNGRLLRLFRERYPEIAQREIPYAFEHWRHPEKALFFFRKRAIEILRSDPNLWRERQRFVVFVYFLLGFWLACGVAIFIAGVLLA